MDIISEVKSNCGRYTSFERRALFHFYGITHDKNAVFQNSVVFSNAEYSDMFGTIINPNPDKNGRFQIRVFKWTCADGTVKKSLPPEWGKTRSETLSDYSASTGAPTGQVSAQEPQPMQVSASITYCVSPCEIAATGQFSAQAPQEMQASVILYAIS